MRILRRRINARVELDDGSRFADALLLLLVISLFALIAAFVFNVIL